MKLLLTCVTRLIGLLSPGNLGAELHSIKLLSRNRPRRGNEIDAWHQLQCGQTRESERQVDGLDRIINLAGEQIAEKRWNVAQKEKLWSSRIDGTRSLVHARGRAKIKPKYLISASAVGNNVPRGDEQLNQASKPGEDVLSRLRVKW